MSGKELGFNFRRVLNIVVSCGRYVHTEGNLRDWGLGQTKKKEKERGVSMILERDSSETAGSRKCFKERAEVTRITDM